MVGPQAPQGAFRDSRPPGNASAAQSVNPHFIFNALNSINAYVQKNDQDSAKQLPHKIRLGDAQRAENKPP
ncbi:MAG: histidine kinase [Flavobacteriales bacterium]|nr:histidine kinase [Flavobacteriales bacterium]